MLEARSCGLPVITTTAGSMRELIETEFSGILIKPNDPKSLSVQIERPLKDPGLREK